MGDVFLKRKAGVYCVFCAIFSCMCLVRLMLRNCSENMYLHKMMFFLLLLFSE